VKALTLTQPWATLVALEEKRIETRGWSTGYRGPLAIHAAKSFPADCRELCETRSLPFLETLRKHGINSWRELPTGVIVCTTDLIDCLKTEQVREAWCLYSDLIHEKDFGNYDDGRYGLLLGAVTRTFVPPLPARGALGLWEWTEPQE
jgi:hypothetical protein